MQLPKISFSNVINGLLVSVLVSFILLIGCHADEYPEPVPIRVTVSGTIIDADTQIPLEGASIRSDNNAVTVVTKADGLFLLENVGVNKIGEVIITFSKEGYPSNQKVFVVEHGKTYSTRLEMKAYGDIQLPEATLPSKEVTITKTTDNDVTIEIPNPDTLNPTNPSAILFFPANSLAGTDAEPITYVVKATVLDPTDVNGDRKLFPGFFLSAPYDFFRPDALLESVVFVHVLITDSKGAQITSLPNPAKFYLRLPTNNQAKYANGDTIKWWSFRNTRGHWGQEASNANVTIPTVVGYSLTDLYVEANVSQLTWFNAGPNMTNLSCLGVTVVDIANNNAPVSGAVVSAQGVTYDGNSLPVITNEYGFAQLLVKPSSTTTTQEVRVAVNQGAANIPLVVVDSNDGDPDTQVVYTSTTANSYIIKNGIEYGDCKNLISPLEVDLSRTVEGYLTYLGSGSPVLNYPVHSDIGISVESNENGFYTMSVPRIAESFYVFSSVEHPVSPVFPQDTVNVPLTVQTPVIDSLTRSVSGTVVESTDVTLSVKAKDLEDPARSLSYAWTSKDDLGNDIGSFVDATLATVLWTAPAGTGIANLNVLVDNGTGGTINQAVVIDYEPAPVP